MFIKKCFLLSSFLLLAAYSRGRAQSDDGAICNRTFSFAFEHKLIDAPVGDVITTIGKQFLNAPYEAGTLEHSDSEKLVINLHSFDCVTLVENAVALARCVKRNRLSYDEFRHDVQKLRYRGGTVNGYASRLHYFSDWINDNERKGIIKNVTRELGGEPFKKTINFMTSHREKYPKLANDSVFNIIRIIEDSLSSHREYFIPKSKIRNHQSEIRNGSIIAITSHQSGLDIAHTGIALRLDDGSLHYMHAPDVKGNVRISKDPLDEYVKRNRNFTGIMVVEVTEPRE